MKVKSESEVTQSIRLLATPWTTAYEVPPSMEFSRQEYWNGLPLPSQKKWAEDLNRHFFKKTYRWPGGTGKDVQYH